MLRGLSVALWSLSAVVLLALAAQPIGLTTQFLLAAMALAVMTAITVLRLQGVWRHVFLAFGTLLILRYLYWRLTETIPSASQPIDFVAAVVLLAAELYCLGMLFLSLFVNASPKERPRAPKLPDAALPTVDILVPSYNEDPELVAVTLAAARAIDYPSDKLRVFLLDDGATEERVHSHNVRIAAAASERRRTLQALCVELGVTYLTREYNVHAKAGNLNNGLSHSSGDLVVVFDADHVPAREFLRETVGYFSEDERLFLVQTPHFFINADPLERNLKTFERMPSENEMFYSAIQKGLDGWNAAFFCGSAAVLRRAALEEVGGFAGVSITEDAETALELHAKGWHSAYVDRPMIAGLQPETFESFIGQRSRWCRGMIQIFMLKKPLTKPGLRFAQRLCYLSSNAFWFFPLSRIVFMLAPLGFIFFNLRIYNATPQEFVAYTMTYLVSALLIQNYVFGRFRWPWISDLYEYVQSMYLFRAIMGVVANPRAPKFNVTMKGATLEEDRLSDLAWPYYAMFALLAAGFAMTGYRFVTEPSSQELVAIVGFWNVMNLVMAGMALGVVSERRERRKVQRLATNRAGELRLEDGPVPVAIDDVSIGGMRVRPLRPMTQQVFGRRRQFLLRVDGTRPGQSYEVPIAFTSVSSTAEGQAFGTSFVGLTGDRFRLVADLAYADLGAMRAKRSAKQRRRSVTLATLELAARSVAETLRGLYFALFRRARPKPTTASRDLTELAAPTAPVTNA